MGTDQDWEQWGAQDPYFGVYSRERFRAGAMDDRARTEFFASGEEHIAKTIKDLERTFGPMERLQSALDFGCGVGRLVIPLALRADRVTGVDVSPSMLEEAKKNCAAAGVTNVSLELSDDALSRARGEFALVHSYIVLQHIPWRRGRKFLQLLADRVAPGGFLAVQILTDYYANPIVRGFARMRYALPPANWLRNLLRGRPVFEPPMQLRVYDLGDVVRDLEARGFTCRPSEEEHPEFQSTLLYAKRQ